MYHQSATVDRARLDDLVIIVATLTAAAVLSVSGLRGLGVQPSLPWPFVILLLLLVPFAAAVHAATQRLSTRSGWAAGILCGLLIMGGTRLPFAGLIWFLTIALVTCRPTMPSKAFWLGLGGLALGYTAVWSLNYVTLWMVRDRLLDAVVREWDIATYAWLTGYAVDYTGWFPIVGDTAARILEAAYLATFPQLVLVLFVLSDNRADVGRFLRQLFMAYGVGLLVFFLFPLAGPFLAEPSAIRTVASAHAAASMEHGRQLEFATIVAGTPSAAGYGYFMALPSLHAAVAVIAQAALRRRSVLFWGLLPVNVLVVIATFALGFHYIVDTVAGVLLGLAMTYDGRRRR